MSLQAAAKHLAAHGRGPDSHLVHMSGKELRGLQALAKSGGTSLTVNPHTGLPEAGNLDRLLPLIAGAASTYFTGTPYLGMALAGGAAYGKSGGDLKSGLMAGLGAYAGGSLMSAGMASGAPETLAPVEDRILSTSATPPPDTFVGPQPNPGANPDLFSSGSAAEDKLIGTNGMSNPTYSQNPADYAGDAATRGNYGAMGESKLTGFEGKDFEPRPDVTPENYGKDYTGGSKDTLLKPEGAATGSGSGAGSAKGTIGGFDTKKLAGAALLGGLMNQSKGASPTSKYSAPTPRYSFNPQTGQYTRLAVGGMADGGAFNYAGDASPVVGMRTGGLSDLGGYSDGGRLLRGPGDGVSDSIPAVIGHKQPARLADGEFVVPARIVSEIGNGSTEAGARKLYAMMDRVQKARSKTTGKKQVAKNTRADKYLPA